MKISPSNHDDVIAFVNPATHNALEQTGDQLTDAVTGQVVGRVLDGVPRFVALEDNYGESFGWQWTHWDTIRKTAYTPSYGLDAVIRDRTRFDEYETEGKTILECGMGGGDDTAVLLTFPFGQIHSFDISSSVKRAADLLTDERLVVSQASILDIPYPDESFDFVYCHRVLQHTPDPVQSLRCICRKVKPGGILFAHSYKRSWRWMSEWRYKYRCLTKRMPHSWIYWYVNTFGKPLHHVNRVLYRIPVIRQLAWNFMPFFKWPELAEGAGVPESQLIELEKCNTFDALTPAHDHPMTSKIFCSTIESEGFEIEHFFDPPVSPLLCTARRR
ncbi:MAG: class I SAM-dependent methyltransferase [Fuerstiella sp.]|nr:class I SAM-dependent methyltransferase [Fuerstiella sp.]